MTIISASGYIITLGIALSNRKFNNYYNNDDYNNNNGDEDGSGDQDYSNSQVSIASQAMLFSFAWTAISSLSLGIFGTMLLGVISPNGNLYSCCPSKIVKVSPMSMGTFIGALLMYANLTLVCAILFGQFNIRDYTYGEEDEGNRNAPEIQYLSEYAIQKSSAAFSFFCLFLTIMYAAFAVVMYTYQGEIMEEILEEMRAEALAPSPEKGLTLHPSGGNNYYAGGPLESPKKFITSEADISPGVV